MEIQKEKIKEVYAYCDNCVWGTDLEENTPKGIKNFRAKIYYHIRKTKHKVVIKEITITTYNVK